MNIPLALSRGDIAEYVDALFLVYFILIFARIVLSWVIAARGSLPYVQPLPMVTEFITQTTDPYLNLFRRLIPPLGGARMAIDISPILAIFVLFIVQGIVVDLIRG
jgi:YggT family protein